MAPEHVAWMIDFLKGNLSLSMSRSSTYSDAIRAMIAKTIIVAHPQANLQGDDGVTYHIPHSVDTLLRGIYPKRAGETDVDLERLKKILLDTEFVVEIGDEMLVRTSIGFVQAIKIYRSLPTGGLAAFYDAT